jgi:hypothetical protein
VEAAFFSRARRRSRRPGPGAALALLAYATAAAVAVDMIGSALNRDAPPAAPAAPRTTGAADLALRTVGARARNSVVSLGANGTGFVAWKAGGLTLILTARPPGGWRTGPGRSVTVAANGLEVPGTLVRADPRTRLGLVRVRETLPQPALWQRRRPARVEPGDGLVAAGTRGVATFVVEEARHAAIWGARPGTTPSGAPVLAEDGRLVGVATGSRVVPIARACGAIRRC